MSIFDDFINGPDGPQFDDDNLTNDYIDSCSGGKPAGVVRWNNGRKETGDRDDTRQERERDEIEQSLRRVREHDDIWDQLDRDRKSQPKRGPRKAQQVYGKHIDGGELPATEYAPSNTRADIYGTPTPGYFAPHDRGQSGSGLVYFTVIICLVVALAQIFLG